MGDLLARAFTEQALLAAWSQARDAALADGEAGPEVDEFEAAAARRVSELAEDLADGSFKPHPAVRVEIVKRSGGFRRLAVPSLTDRIVERALLAELDQVIDPLLLPWSFAYRHGLGVKDAIACLVEAREAGSAWVARADIDGCFDHIPRWEVLRRLRECVADSEAVDLVRLLMERPVFGERRKQSDRGLGLHQGSPLSPLLCNLYLDAFDRSMLAMGYRVIRYSDDLAIPVADRTTAERALSDAAEALADLRLSLDPAKSLVVPFDEGVPFLGTTVTATTSPGAAALSHPLETVVYVDRPGSLLRSRGERLTVEHQDEILFRLNLRRIRQVVCIGRVGMTTPFLHRALRDGIDIVLLDEHGGPEGAATREYFRAWRDDIETDWGFTARLRRPPPDPVNAMLSFGYTLLASEAIAALCTAGLDPAVGFLHQARWGRPNLALDLMEEFRPVLVDAVVLRCLATGIVRQEDFTIEPDAGCRMNPRARHSFLAAYERRMLTLYTHEPAGRRVSHRVGIGLQARALARAILDPDRPCRPIRWK